MKRSTLFAPVLVLLISAALLPERSGEASTIVKLDPVAPSAAALSLTSEGDDAGLPEGWKYLRAVDLYIVDERGQDHLSALEAEGAVAALEDGSDIQLEALPNDPMADVQGWITGIHVDIGASEAWDLGTGSEAVVVAIIDTGISADHPDLNPNLWTNPNEIPGNGKDDDDNGYADDVHGFDFWGDEGDVADGNNHGSHLAGIIGAAGNDGLGVTGINWNVRLMPLKFTDEHGRGTSALAVEAINYAIEHGARVINASWTLKIDSVSGSGRWEQGDLLRQAIDKAGEAGILFVTAAGNQFKTYQGLNIDNDPVYPASFANDNMMAVAALDSEGFLAAYSNYGPATVGIAAPGSGIYSTGAHGNYAVMSGTSIATAFVSGAAALVLSVNPNLSWDQVKAILEDSTEGEASLNGRIASQGSLNLYNAIALASGGNVPTPSPSYDSSPEEVPTSGEPPPAYSPSPSRAFAFPAGGCSLIK